MPGDILPTLIQSSRGSGFEFLYLALGTQDYSNLAVKSVKETYTEEYTNEVVRNVIEKITFKINL